MIHKKFTERKIGLSKIHKKKKKLLGNEKDT